MVIFHQGPCDLENIGFQGVQRLETQYNVAIMHYKKKLTATFIIIYIEGWIQTRFIGVARTPL